MNTRLVRWYFGTLLAVTVTAMLLTSGLSFLPDVFASPDEPIEWTHLSSVTGDIPSPAGSAEQTAALIVDIDKDGLNDFVIGTRRSPGPSLLWFRRTNNGWTRHVIDSSALRIEAGGAYYDVDGDGDQDIVMGGDGGVSQIWWWENPLPSGDPTATWTRRLIKNSGEKRHHDLLFADIDGDGKDEFVFWNQNALSLFYSEIPANPRQTTEPWFDVTGGNNVSLIFRAPGNRYEGLAAADINLDGKVDLVGGGYWFEHTTGKNFTSHSIAPAEWSRVAVGQLVPGGRPEVVQSPGDTGGMARWYEWDGANWVGHDLFTVDHAHTLDVADVDDDGNLDIFMAEMAFDTRDSDHNPTAKTWILFGDGAGGFTTSVVATGYGNHESRIGDLDGDGDLDILGKPYDWDTPRLGVWLNGPSNGGTICEPLKEWDRFVVGNSGTHRNVLVNTADLDGDNDLDIVAGKHWYENPGTPSGSWQQHAVGGTFNQFAVAGDFDGDGDIDLLGTVSNDATKSERGNAFVWARNDGAANFTILDNIEAGKGDFLQGVVYGPLANGAAGIALSWHRSSDGVQMLTVPGNPSNTDWFISLLSATTQNEDLSAGDIDRDGDSDLLLGTLWLENNGSGSWIDHAVFSPPGVPDRNELADINGDGRLDAVIGYEAISRSGKLAWYKAPVNPEQAWAENLIANVIGPMSVGVADLDGDGDRDVVVGEHSTSDPTSAKLHVYENANGLGSNWQEHLVYTGDEHHDGTHLADIDADGDLDIISIGWTHGRVHLYVQNSCGTSVPPTSTPPNTPTVEPTPSSSPDPAVTSTSMSTPTTTATSTATPVATTTPSASPTPGTSQQSKLWLSSSSSGSINGIAFAGEDILQFDLITEAWALWLDGSDIGLGNSDIDALALTAEGDLLFSIDAPASLPDVGQVDDSDLILFTPTSTGDTTAGAFTLFMDGSAFDLTSNGEDIDAVAFNADGDLLISTLGTAKVPGLTAADEDLILVPVSSNGQPEGGWTLYLDGSDVSLRASSEDINGVWVDETGSAIYFTTSGKVTAGGVTATFSDIILCAATSRGANTACDYPSVPVWKGTAHGFDRENVDAFAFSAVASGPPTGFTPTPTATASTVPTATASPIGTPTATATPLPAGTNWAFGDRRYRQTVSLDTGAAARTDKPVDVAINFTTALGSAGAGGAFDSSSIRVAEVSSQGALLNASVPFQFDPAADFDAGNNAVGTLVVMMTGSSSAAAIRYFQVYFDTNGAGFSPVTVAPWVTLAANEQDEGFDSYRIGTTSGTYYYHKQGGGFSSLVDADGLDWISWNAATGLAGDYRGVPNMVHPNDGGYFHPGRTDSSSALIAAGPLKVTILSTSSDGKWQTRWEILPAYARLTVLQADAKFYFLYEGTPGGALESTDLIIRPNGAQTSGTGDWLGDLPNEEWAYIRDAALPRSLFAIHEEDDTLTDSYRQIGGDMTVLGFGRNDKNARYLSQTPAHFIFGLVEETNHTKVTAAVHSAYKPVAVTLGTVEVKPDG